MNFTKLATFLNRKLWYQFGKLIQSLLFFIKNSKLVSFEQKGDLWFLYGKSTFSFYKKFKGPIKRNMVNLIPNLLISGIIKYELFYIEDRISFIENEFLTKCRICEVSLTGEFLVLSILIFSKLGLGWKKKINKWFNQLKLIKKSRQELSLLEILFDFFEEKIINKSYFYEQDQFLFSVLSANKLRYKKSIFKISNSIQNMSEFYQKKTIHDLQIFPTSVFTEKLGILRASLSNNNEKNSWFTDCHLLRTKYTYKKKQTIFFQKPVENFLPHFFPSWVYRVSLFNKISFILNGKKTFKNSRWSEVGRLNRFPPNGFGLVLLNFSRIVRCKVFINQNRQLIKVKKNPILERNSITNYKFRKNILFIRILNRFSVLKKTLNLNSI